MKNLINTTLIAAILVAATSPATACANSNDLAKRFPHVFGKTVKHYTISINRQRSASPALQIQSELHMKRGYAGGFDVIAEPRITGCYYASALRERFGKKVYLVAVNCKPSNVRN